MSKKLAHLAAAATLVLTAGSAMAAIIPVPLSITPDGVNYRWSYSASIGTNLRVNPGDFFTIYDFGDLVGNPQMPANWTFASADTGANPIFVAATDDPTIPNLTFRYEGTTPLVGSLDLGTFSVDSTTDLPTTADFAAQATHDGGTQDGKFVSNHGTIEVPLDTATVSTAVPEPASATLIMGFGGLLLANRRRANRA